jgi:hypothetical protein
MELSFCSRPGAVARAYERLRVLMPQSSALTAQSDRLDRLARLQVPPILRDQYPLLFLRRGYV